MEEGQMDRSTSPLEEDFPACRVCGGATHNRFTAQERYFGLGDSFDYVECRACGCVQIVAIPDDLGRYYATGYYSFTDQGKRRSWRKRVVDRWALSGRPWFAAPLHALKPNPFFRLLRQLGTTPAARLLDVGCGRGALVQELRSHGFSHCRGVDAFIGEEVCLGEEVLVARKEITDVTERYDGVMFHHSLEHMPDQYTVLRQARRLVVDNGWVVVRIPTVSSFSYRHYKELWAALDAPRHLYLHSRRSICELAERCGFRVAALIDDATDFQFWGSERYRRDIPLNATDPTRRFDNKALFSAAERRSFRARTRALNCQGEGDQICLVLRPVLRP